MKHIKQYPGSVAWHQCCLVLLHEDEAACEHRAKVTGDIDIKKRKADVHGIGTTCFYCGEPGLSRQSLCPYHFVKIILKFCLNLKNLFSQAKSIFHGFEHVVVADWLK